MDRLRPRRHNNQVSGLRVKVPRALVAGLALLVLSTAATAAVPARPASASVPPGPLDHHPALGHLVRTSTPNVTPAAKLIDGRASGWSQGVTLTHLGGSTTIQAGQLIYEDWLMDDLGAARACVVQREDTTAPLVSVSGFDKYYADDSALGEELIPDADATGLLEQPPGSCLKGEERYGDALYPAGATPGSADIQEFRVAADAANVYFLVRFNAMTATDQPVVAVAVDADHNLATGAGDWGMGSLVHTPGADHVITLTRARAYVDGFPASGARVASNDGGRAGPANPGGFGGFLEASVPRSSLAATSAWRLWAGSGVWDPGAQRWKAPRYSTDPSPDVLNLAFRGTQEPFRVWMEHDQAFDLRRGWNGTASVLGAHWAQEVNINSLAAGANETWRATPGYYTRVFSSRVTDGGHSNSSSPESEGISSHQMYGLYIPTTYRPSVPNRMLLWLHWRGPGDHQAAYYVPGMTNELGEQRGSIVVSPRGRGTSGWYVGDSQIDVLDAMNDAQAFLNVDPERVDVAGYSMGGWGTYMMSMLYPDRFAAAFATVGPPAIGLWAYPLAPGSPQNGRPLYWTNPIVHNAEHVPTVIYHGTDDELVPVSGAIAQAQTYQQNKQPYRFFLFPGYEHFSFALADEYLAAQQYLGTRSRVKDPAHVVYSRLPCLDPVNWSPLYNVRGDHAYWVSGITTRVTPSPAVCVNTSSSLAALNVTGTIDVTSHMRPRYLDVGGPVAGVATIPQQSTPAAMTGYEPRQGEALPRENVLDAHLTNVLAATVDTTRAGFDPCTALVVNTVSDAPSTLTLTGAFAVNLAVPAGTNRFVLPLGSCRPPTSAGGGGGAITSPAANRLPTTSVGGVETRLVGAVGWLAAVVLGVVAAGAYRRVRSS
jgi:pimeloyl-ACP methyl ester carboxylesterase